MIKVDAELKALIPPLSKEEYEQLERNILAEGIREPIIVWEDTIIDGHNRYEIACKHRVQYNTITKKFDNKEDVKQWMIINQLGRRNLAEFVKYELLEEYENIEKQKGKDKRALNLKQNSEVSVIDTSGKQQTRQKVADKLNWSTGKTAQAKIIKEKAPEAIKEKLRNNELSINQAYNEIKKIERKEDIQKQKECIEKGTAILPEGLFEVIAIDPPWNYGTQFDGEGRRVANPYPEMNQAQLNELIIPSADNSVLFLWTTHRFIWDAKELLDHWGFTYRSMIVWDKEKIGMGDLFRMQCEFCLVGIKGKPIFDNNHTWRDIIKEPRREHSRKPEAFYDMVNELCIGRKLDYFSRQQRQGWETFGNDDRRF